MAETATAETTAETTEAEATTGAATASTETEGQEALGDAGKKALDAMKAKWKEAETTAKAAEQARAELQAKLDGKEAEYKATQERAELEKAALNKANDRIRRSEVKAAAKGVLADPQDAYKFLDLDSFEVDDDGNVDESAISTAIANLVKEKPYLAAQGKRFEGSADGGARNDASMPSQLTKSDLDRMSPAEVDQAHKEGRFNKLLGG